MLNKRLITQSLCFFIITLFPIYAEISIEDMSKNFKMTDYEPLRVKFDSERLKRPFFINIGMPDSLKVSVISFGYHWNKFLSVGISRNAFRQYYNDEGSTDGYDKGKYGIMSYGQSTSWQDYGGVKGAPDIGFNFFLHYYPFPDFNVPFYIPLYIGRSLRSQVIWNSENVMIRPGALQNPVISMEADYLPSNYIGSGLGVKFALPEGISFGMEFGYVKMLHPELDFNLRGSYLNRTEISIADIFFYEQLFKRAFPGTDIAKLNYGILIGIGF